MTERFWDDYSHLFTLLDDPKPDEQTKVNKSWIQSFTGCKVEPLALTPDMVCLEDIAHALSMKTRFTGHCREFYSVAEHCVVGSQVIAPAFALPFLLHEVSEAYLPDIAGPVKPSVRLADGRTWAELEEQHARVILEALGLSSLLPLLSSPEVKKMDWQMLAAEALVLHSTPPDSWKLPHEPAKVYLPLWAPNIAKREFLDAFKKLTGGQ